ncbi:MAG: hypothetical protein HUU01_14840 [Saprospiraceae bacterium]|nr:hypothetical protein [Saprospiraceae bacterium]
MKTQGSITLQQYADRVVIFIPNEKNPAIIAGMSALLIAWCYVLYQFILPVLDVLTEGIEGRNLSIILVLGWGLGAIHQLSRLLYLLFGGVEIEASKTQIRVKKRWALLSRSWRYAPADMSNIRLRDNVVEKLPEFIKPTKIWPITFDNKGPGNPDTLLPDIQIEKADALLILKTLLDRDILRPDQVKEPEIEF